MTMELQDEDTEKALAERLALDAERARMQARTNAFFDRLERRKRQFAREELVEFSI